jgi:predicted metal-binding membrane protein
MNEDEPAAGTAAGRDNRSAAGFILACAAAFIISVAATVHFCRSMCCELDMPGGWTMSMMWLGMRGQTGAGSATSFLLMWLAMMVAMMMPSALPMFLSARRALTGTRAAPALAFLTLMAAGYFTIWLAIGAGIYALGIGFAVMARHWEAFSRAVPVLSGAALVAAGAMQFTRWKMAGLLRCRSPLGCAGACPERNTGFLLGCKQGAACCVCCTGPIIVQLALGMMNPLVLVGVASVIAAEKLLPRPEWVARVAGVATIVMGSVIVIRKLMTG